MAGEAIMTPWPLMQFMLRQHQVARLNEVTDSSLEVAADDQQSYLAELCKARLENEHLREDLDHCRQACDRVVQLEQDLAEALKGRLLVPLWNVERDICRMSTRVSLDLPYCEFDECQDRKEFRRKLARELTKMGDAFMAAWEQLHGEQS